ncbi:hypothetical protein K402DRAFT_208 [Aulographum hederae CBS 113979]|uniref:Uncharacterized protein n=1 Tax=Aulographum hederae CBS 113979 TaxID=1176131 RepID=A0A6G1HGV0_9PEZI|nr:hypothetical protein K402DRAFT_208 [Aulographum hederae CBS 113979]
MNNISKHSLSQSLATPLGRISFHRCYYCSDTRTSALYVIIFFMTRPFGSCLSAVFRLPHIEPLFKSPAQESLLGGRVGRSLNTRVKTTYPVIKRPSQPRISPKGLSTDIALSPRGSRKSLVRFLTGTVSCMSHIHARHPPYSEA